MKKYDYIDLMKTVAMFMVMIAHCILFWGNNIFWPMRADHESAVAIFIYNFFDVACLPIFVFAAGFLFQLSLQRKKYGTVELIKKRALRLLVPCFVYGALWVVPLYTLLDIPVFGRDKGTSLIDGYKAMLLGRFADVNWFLLMLFWVVLIWILCRGLLIRERILLGAVAALIFFFIAHFGLAGVDFYKISQIDIHILEYFTGAAFFYVADDLKEKMGTGVKISVSAIALAVCVLAAQLIAEYYIVACVLRVMIPVFFVILAMGLDELAAVRRFEATKANEWIVKNNLYIYLFQAPGLYVGYLIFYPVLGKSVPACVLAILLFVLITDWMMVSVFNYVKNSSFTPKL